MLLPPNPSCQNRAISLDQISNLVEIVNKQVIAPAKAVEKTCVTYGGAHAYYECIATDSNPSSVCAATGSYNQVSPPNRASHQIPPPGFAPVQIDPNMFNQNQGQGNYFNQANNFNPGNNFRGNNFQNNQGYRAQMNNALNFQNQVFQNQPFSVPNNQIPPSVPNEFLSYIKSNEIAIKSMQNQINVLMGDFSKHEENLRRNLNDDMRNILSSFFQNQPLTSGTLPSNTISNLKGKMKAVTTRSGLAYEGPSIPTKSPLKKIDEQNTEEILEEHFNSSGSTTHCCQFQFWNPMFRGLSLNLHFHTRLGMEVCHPLADLGASINLMPLSIWKKLSLPELTPTRMTLELADRSITRPKGIAEDVFVKVAKFHFPTDFVVVDFEADPRVPLILRRSFLRTGRALIDVYGEEITLRVNDESITFNLNQTMRYSSTYDDTSVNRVDVIDVACEDFVQDVLDFQYNPKVAVLLWRNLSFEEPPELELKELPSHLEYAFLEDSNKLPIIIAKNLKMDEKEALINILMEDDYKPAVQSQRRVNPKIHDVIKKEVIKIFDAGYFQIPIDPQDQEKATFTCPYGTFTYRRMPFNLCNAPGTFQRCMMSIFHDMIEKTMEVFMDDFLVFGDSFSSCLTNLDKMPNHCEETNLVLNWEKCHFMCREGIVLGHKISKSGIKVDRAKVDDFSKIARPMTHLLEKETPFVFSKECIDSFNTLKKKLTEAPIVVVPDWNLPFELMCNASDYAIGAVLGQRRVMIKYGVTHRLATAYHPQTSGQVEVSNHGLKRILERTVGENRTSWAYWALKRVNFDLKTAGDHRKLQLNELSELRDQTYENSMIYKERTKKLHDSKIKNRIFNVDDQVFLFNSRLKVFSGKLKTRWSGPFTITHVFPYDTIELSQPNGLNFKVNGHRVKHYFGGDIPSNVASDLHTFPKDN
nr:hypothetical protein [Tanacetum cinerariifolium]